MIIRQGRGGRVEHEEGKERQWRRGEGGEEWKEAGTGRIMGGGRVEDEKEVCRRS